MLAGAELRRFRKDHRMTQGQLAQRLGVNLQTISRWEREEVARPPLLALALVGLACALAHAELNADRQQA